MEMSMIHYTDNLLLYIPMIDEFDAEEFAPILNLERRLATSKIRYEAYEAYEQRNGSRLVYYDVEYNEGIVAKCFYCYHINHSNKKLTVEYLNANGQLRYIEIAPRSYGTIKLK